MIDLEAGTPEGARARYRRLLPWVLIAAAGVNVALLPRLPEVQQPIRVHASGDLTHLVHVDNAPAARRYGFYLRLADTLPAGATLIVPPGSFVEAPLVEAFAGSVVERRRYDPDLGEALMVPAGETAVVATAGDAARFTYWIAPGPPADVHWLGTVGDVHVVVPASLLPPPQEVDGG